MIKATPCEIMRHVYLVLEQAWSQRAWRLLCGRQRPDRRQLWHPRQLLVHQPRRTLLPMLVVEHDTHAQYPIWTDIEFCTTFSRWPCSLPMKFAMTRRCVRIHQQTSDLMKANSKDENRDDEEVCSHPPTDQRPNESQ
jgi:hypothetical protein